MSWRNLYVLILLILAPSTACANLAESAHWRGLIYHQNGGSEVDDPSFFLHNEGRFKPEQELRASLEAFGSVREPKDGHPICRFPLRYRWLNEKLGKPWQASFEGCKAYQRFRDKLSAKSLALMFSTHRPNDPNSAFGHLFIKVSQFSSDETSEMLDYGVSFGADTRGETGWNYIAKGLTGGFRGTFSILPYYYKVREYSDFQSRNVWAYPLKLSATQVEAVIDHLWELQSISFAYFYLRENCAYRILSLLQVALREDDLLKDFGWWTIPSDAIRILEQRRLIGLGRERPAMRTRLLNRSRRLSLRELEVALALVEGRKEASATLALLGTRPAARVLDAAIDAFDYLYTEDVLLETPQAMGHKQAMLIARARNPTVGVEEPPERSPSPGHASGRITLGAGEVQGLGGLTLLELRPLYHDWLDPIAGKPKSAASEFATLGIAYRKHGSQSAAIVLERLSLFSLRNYPAMNFWETPLAYEASLGIDQRTLRICGDCPKPLGALALGKSLTDHSESFLLAILLNSELEFHNFYEHNFRLGLGPKLAGRFLFSDRVSLGLEFFHGLNSYAEDRIFTDQLSSLSIEGRWHLSRDISFTLISALSRFRGREERRFVSGVQYFY